LEEKERKQAEKRARQEAFRQKANEEEKVCILCVRTVMVKTADLFLVTGKNIFIFERHW